MNKQPKIEFEDHLLDLPVLSIRAPWTWAILNAGKDIENRSKPTIYRGEFLIHASKTMTRNYYDAAVETIRSSFLRNYKREFTVPAQKDLVKGGVVGIAEIYDCVEKSDSEWFSGPYGYKLRNVRALPFYPCKGQLGFFRIKLNP